MFVTKFHRGLSAPEDVAKFLSVDDSLLTPLAYLSPITPGARGEIRTQSPTSFLHLCHNVSTILTIISKNVPYVIESRRIV